MKYALLLFILVSSAFAGVVFGPWNLNIPPVSGGGGATDFTNGLYYWFYPPVSVTNTANGSAVSWTFNASSSVTLNFSQAFGPQQPFWTNSSTLIGNRGGIVFTNPASNPTTLYVGAMPTNVASSYTYFFVYWAHDGGNSTEQRLMDIQNGRTIFRQNDGANKYGWYNGSTLSSGTSAAGMHFLEFDLDATAGAVEVMNGIPLVTNSYTSQSIGGGGALSGDNSGSGSVGLNGILAEVRIYSNLVSTANRSLIRTALTNRYGNPVP